MQHDLPYLTLPPGGRRAEVEGDKRSEAMKREEKEAGRERGEGGKERYVPGED